MDKLKLFLLNWKTSVPAGLAMLCSGLADVAGVVPDDYMRYAHATCAFLLAVGLISAKDADKTHSKVVVQPQPDPVTVPVEGADKAKVVAPVILLLLTGLLAGCGSTKGTWLDTTGTMLDGTVCTIASEANNAEMTDQIIHTYVGQKDQEKAQAYLATAKLGATALCEMLRARQAVQAQGNPAPTTTPVQGPVKPS